MKFDIYQSVTNKIIEAIEAGAGDLVMPWHRGGAGGIPVNALTHNEYQGINILNLWLTSQAKHYSSNEWCTFKQWRDKGCKVRKGEKASHIVFFKKMVVKKNDEERVIPLIRYSHGFNADQVDDYERPDLEGDPLDRIDSVEEYVTNIGAEIIVGGVSAYFAPSDDTIHMPDGERFLDTESGDRLGHYYSALLHELTHWSGAKKRLNRDMGGRFGNESYAMEELVAELGSAFQCAKLGIDSEPRIDHAQYLANWLKVLKNDKKAIFTASAKAQEAVTFLGGDHG
jgi:antirestriction protein ArdC